MSHRRVCSFASAVLCGMHMGALRTLPDRLSNAAAVMVYKRPSSDGWLIAWAAPESVPVGISTL